MRNPYQHHRKPQCINRGYEVSVLDDPTQRAKLLEMVRKDVAAAVHDNQYGVKSTWHLDLRQGPYLAGGWDVMPGDGDHRQYLALTTRDYPDPRSLPVIEGTWIYLRQSADRTAMQAVEHIQTFAERRAPSLQQDPAKKSKIGVPSRTPEPEYEPGD